MALVLVPSVSREGEIDVGCVSHSVSDAGKLRAATTQVVFLTEHTRPG